MHIARLQSELQKTEPINESQVNEFARICSLQLTRDPLQDILNLSKAILDLREFTGNVRAARYSFSQSSFLRHVARAPMAQTPLDEDFV